ncbi:RNase A-like domain-containing protein [Streptomyces sp. NPDC019224]|uniref:RNase A-like domain-containing protein n=1 Tax=Streptomyces sp. NPDC019224 TaxID=3154484 RepID=UPI0033D4222E
MSVADKAKQIVQHATGMWWPDADEDSLRDAAKVWRDFADDLEKVTAAANKSARGIIEHNKGEAISAFDDPFWRRYYYGGHGWLQDMIDASRDIAKSLDQYADAVHHAVKRLEHELEIVGATIAAGTLLAVFTVGISEGAAVAATGVIVDLSATLGVTVSTEIATIAGTTLATAAIGGIESVTVDLAVTQPGAIILGESKGFSLDEVQNAAEGGALMGGLLGSAGSTYRAINDAGGMSELLGGIRMPTFEPNLALPGGGSTSLEDLGLLIKGDGEANAWPRSKRKGAYKPKYGADLAGDEGKGTATSHSHTLDRHVEVTTQDLRARLRGDENLDNASRYVDEASAQKHTQAVVLKHQKEIDEWLNNGKPAGKKDFTVDLSEPTGLSLSRSNFKNGLPPEWVTGATVVLKKDPTAALGYRVLTSYPTAQ